MMKHLFFVLLTFLLAAFSVRAFGTEGNQAVGYIAMHVSISVPIPRAQC